MDSHPRSGEELRLGITSIADLAAQMNACRSVGEAAEAVVAAAQALCELPYAVLLVVEGTGLRPAAARGRELPRQSDPLVALATEALESGEVRELPERAASGGGVGSSAGRGGTVAALPLQARGAMVGVLVCQWADSPPEPSTTRALGALFAVGIANARVLESERRLLHRLGERIKELSVLHAVTRALQDESASVSEQLHRIVELLPQGWQYPDVAAARVAFGDTQAASPGYAPSRWRQAASFATSEGRGGEIEVVYLAERPGADEGPFLKEERELLDSIAEVLRIYLGQRLALESLRSERERLKTILDQMPEGVLVTDAEGRLGLINEAARAFVLQGKAPGVLPKDEFGNEILFDLRLPSGEKAPLEQIPLWRALSRQETVTGVELELRPASGARVAILASAAPIRGSDGSFFGVAAVFQDISRVKDLDRLRQQWTSLVAHEVRQPITTMLTAAQMLERLGRARDSTEAEARALARVVNSANRLERMIGDLVDVTRVESGRLQLSRQALELPGVVSEVLEWAAELTAGRPVRPSIPSTPLPQVVADRGRVEQVLWNLISNAVKYGAPATPIGIALRRRDDDFVEVSVNNLGEAIPPEEQKRMFTPYFRGRRAEQGSEAGFGLGLYVVKGIVEAHGGTVQAESSPEGVTTVRFTLPVVRAHGD